MKLPSSKTRTPARGPCLSSWSPSGPIHQQHAARRPATATRLPVPTSQPYRLVGRLSRMQSLAFMSELEPVAARLLDRHLAGAREWFPHELIPYERGRAATGRPWTEADADLA